ncbi:MAG: lysozyme [Ferruginibacter sp.]
MTIAPDINKLAAIKEAFEGFQNVAYLDTGGVWTVGYGSTYNHDKKRKVQKGDVISKDHAKEWMNIDLQEIRRQLSLYIKVELSAHQAAAICDYVYNRGIGNFLKTQLDELINANPNDLRIKDEILKTGIKDRLGNLLWGLGRRRRAEAHLYFTGQLKFDWPRW